MSLTGAILMNVNLMVGASAFIAPTIMAEYADSASFYGWLFAGMVFFPVVWCIAQAASLFPGKGSFYSYSKNTISDGAGFLSGWSYFLGYVSIGAMQTLSLNEVLAKQVDLTFVKAHPLLFNLGLLSVLLGMSWLSVRVIDSIQSSGTIFKLTPLLIGIGSLLIYFSPSNLPSFTQTSPLLLLPTVPLAIFGFWGFEGVCSVSHLIEDNKKNAPRAVLIGFFIAVSIYCLFHLSLIALMGAKALKMYGVGSFVNYLGISNVAHIRMLNAVILSAIIVAHVNAIFGGIVANSSMFCAMAEEKLLFLSNQLSTRVPATSRPFGAAVAHTIGIIFCTSILAHKIVLNAMSNLGVLIAFFMTIISILTIQLKNRQIIGQMISVLGLGSCAFLAYQSWYIIGINHWQRLVAAGPLILVMILGYGMFLNARRGRNA
jgi:amino acid transporter